MQPQCQDKGRKLFALVSLHMGKQYCLDGIQTEYHSRVGQMHITCYKYCNFKCLKGLTDAIRVYIALFILYKVVLLMTVDIYFLVDR